MNIYAVAIYLKRTLIPKITIIGLGRQPDAPSQQGRLVCVTMAAENEQIAGNTAVGWAQEHNPPSEGWVVDVVTMTMVTPEAIHAAGYALRPAHLKIVEENGHGH